MRSTARVIAGGLAATLVAASLSASIGASPAAAASVLSVSRTTVDANAPTAVSVSGRTYERPKVAEGNSAFGGVYVFFGWVKGGAWGPSSGGSFGSTYAYPGQQGDAGSRDDGNGSIRLVSFTEEGSSGGSTPHHMDANGNWNAPLTVDLEDGTFVYLDTAGDAQSVDCRAVTCGVFTIGAHGKTSGPNEKFTPIKIAGSSGSSKNSKSDKSKSDKDKVGSKSGGSKSGGKKAVASSTPTPSAEASEAPAKKKDGEKATSSAVAVPTVPAPTAPVPVPSPSDSTVELDAALASDSSDGPGALPWVIGLLVVLALAAGGGTYWARRRGTAG
jgi:hypothetical protein